MAIAMPKHLEFSTKFVFPFFHSRFKQFRFLLQIYNICNNHLLFDERTLGSKSTWRSFKASRGGDSRAIGSWGNVGNLEPNKALHLKFDENFNGAMAHSIDLKF
jgi:hypothetical protein